MGLDILLEDLSKDSNKMQVAFKVDFNFEVNFVSVKPRWVFNRQGM